MVSHLPFADDTIFFCTIEENQARAIQELIGRYERALGQQVNFSKTNVSFSKGVRPEKRTLITHCLDIREVLSHKKYFGPPTAVGRSHRKPFLYIVERIRKCKTGWMEKLMSWARREVLIKPVAQTMQHMH